MDYILCSFIIFSCFSNGPSSASFTPTQSLCHKKESTALIKLKQSLTINETASTDPSAHNKIASWKFEGESSSNCCSWDGVDCDKTTGHVIGLDLSSSFLFGSINSSSTLFTLVHLQLLNLADNHFNYSQIPSEIGSLSGLKTLDLSFSAFSGPIPQEISHLSKLVSLDLSDNRKLKIENPVFESLFQNLTRLEELDLGVVDISSKVPDSIANLFSLRTLRLGSCNISGSIPQEISHLSKLVSLDLSNSNVLKIENHVFESLFQNLTFLEELNLEGAGISSKVPNSIANLFSLRVLVLRGCNFSGSIPTSIGNLSQLVYLDLATNSFSGQVPSLVGLSKLWYLDLANNNLQTVDDLIWLGNLTKLIYLSLSGKDLNGSVLSTCHNRTHTVSCGLYSTTSLPKFDVLFLEDCNLMGFPDFLRYQDELEMLALAENEIHGQIPTWILNVSKESLGVLDLSYNFLTGFEQHQAILAMTSLRYLDLQHNMLQGPLPILPPNLTVFEASGNSFTGNIPTSICQLSFLLILKLDNNSLTGTIPPCLSNFSDSLSILTLGGNNLRGPIPQNFSKKSKLKMIDLSRNQLQGKVPRTLENCKLLRSLDLSRNLIEDVFPFWLGSLPNLQILLLGSNRLGGVIRNPKSEIVIFPNLRVFVICHNNFTGHFPGKYFKAWNAMRSSVTDQDKYLLETVRCQISDVTWVFTLPYVMNITSKGVNTDYEKILSIFTAIDLSSNKFEGEIPESIGNLKGLELLNLSNNGLSGEIPSSLGNLKNLESLDISRNKLSGKIPQQLTELNFLELLNVSYNNLTGPIPKGKQFNTFQNDSYEGNLGLCGDPLSRKCGSVTTSLPPSFESGGADDGYVFPSGFDWVVIGLGYGSGVVVGVVIGRKLTGKYHDWFIETFSRKKRKQTRPQRRGRRN